MKLKLLANTALLKRLTPPAKSDGGILYADRYRDDRRQYCVLAVGPGKRQKDGSYRAPEVQPGQCCLYNPDMGNIADLDDGTILVNAARIECVWQPNSPSPCV
jgi:chaperonin GroES